MRVSFSSGVFVILLTSLPLACSSGPAEPSTSQAEALAPSEPLTAEKAGAPRTAEVTAGSITTAGTVGIFGRACADGSVEQTFLNGMVGCAGRATWENRGQLCGVGYRPASAREWSTHRGSTAPSHNYWTEDALRFQGSAAGCSVDRYAGFSCGSEPMRVCTEDGADPEGNACNWRNCGLQTVTPNQYFGGCAGNPTAGALCVPNSCAGAPEAGTCRSLFAEYIAWVERGDYLSLVGTSMQRNALNAGGVVSYLRGDIYTRPTPGVTPRAISGSLVPQLFNDRTTTSGQPFDRAAADQVSIELNEEGELRITLDSWGHGRLIISPTACAQGVTYGFSDDGTLWSFVFRKEFLPG